MDLVIQIRMAARLGMITLQEIQVPIVMVLETIMITTEILVRVVKREWLTRLRTKWEWADPKTIVMTTITATTNIFIIFDYEGATTYIADCIRMNAYLNSTLFEVNKSVHVMKSDVTY